MPFILWKKLWHVIKKRKFEFSAWMKKLNGPLNVFDFKPPTYKEITSTNNKLKSSGSPCLHDQMSIIILKGCPILKTFMHKIILHCWREQKFPSCWKHAFNYFDSQKGFQYGTFELLSNNTSTCFWRSIFIVYLK